MDALARFEREFTGWVLAHNAAKHLGNDPVSQLAKLSAKIPADLQRQIGNAFAQGWLENEPGAGRGYFVRATEPNPVGCGDYVFSGSNVCWELFVQLADFGMVKAAAERHGFGVGLEDGLMDITVRTGSGLLLYIENKVEEGDAANLARNMMRYADEPVPPKPDTTARQPDHFKKAHYLLEHRPRYFAVSAIGYRKLFKVEYIGDSRFRLVEEDRGFTDMFNDHPPIESADARPPSMPISRMESELQRLLGERIWLNLGSGQTVYNFYTSVEGRDALIVGVYEDGRVWTANDKLGKARMDALADELGQLGITLKTEKSWTFWCRGESKLDLHDVDLDVVGVAEAVAAAIGQ